MGIFRPKPMELKYGEPVHVMIARAFLNDAIRIGGDVVDNLSWHFKGPHGVIYRGSKRVWRHEAAESVAAVCELVQQDFNERTAAMTKAREYARENLTIPPLFASAVYAEETN